MGFRGKKRKPEAVGVVARPVVSNPQGHLLSTNEAYAIGHVALSETGGDFDAVGDEGEAFGLLQFKTTAPRDRRGKPVGPSMFGRFLKTLDSEDLTYAFGGRHRVEQVLNGIGEKLNEQETERINTIIGSEDGRLRQLNFIRNNILEDAKTTLSDYRGDSKDRLSLAMMLDQITQRGRSNFDVRIAPFLPAGGVSAEALLNAEIEGLGKTGTKGDSVGASIILDRRVRNARRLGLAFDPTQAGLLAAKIQSNMRRRGNKAEIKRMGRLIKDLRAPISRTDREIAFIKSLETL